MNNILITGGSRGIGFEFTRQYLTNGHRVFKSSRNLEKSSELQKLKTDFDGQLSICQLDVRNEDTRHQLFRQLSKEIDQLDILSNNAGIASGNEECKLSSQWTILSALREYLPVEEPGFDQSASQSPMNGEFPASFLWQM